MAEIIDGKKVALECRKEVAQRAAAFQEKHGRAPGLGVILVGLVSPPSRRGSTASDASLPLRRDRDIVGVVVHPGGAVRADEAFDEVKRERTGHGGEAHSLRANRRGKRRDGLASVVHLSRVRRRRRGVRVRELVNEGVAEERADGEGGECADHAAGRNPGARAGVGGRGEDQGDQAHRDEGRARDAEGRAHRHRVQPPTAE